MGQSGTAEFVDVLPVLLVTMNVPIPKNVDGRVLSEVFSRKLSPVYITPYLQRIRDKHAFKPEEEKQIKDRLLSLDYL